MPPAAFKSRLDLKWFILAKREPFDDGIHQARIERGWSISLLKEPAVSFNS
jgi:hypothetical protein